MVRRAGTGGPAAEGANAQGDAQAGPEHGDESLSSVGSKGRGPVDAKSRVEWGWWDDRSYEWPRCRNILDTGANAGRGGRWDVRSYGGPAVRCGSEFEIMDMVIIKDLILGCRPGSYRVDSERIR